MACNPSFYRQKLFSLMLFSLFLSFFQCTSSEKPRIEIKGGEHIIWIGNNLCSRMMNFGFFETEMHLRFPNDSLFIRNMCDAGNTPGFRPHSGRPGPWAFPGAEQYQSELANESESIGTFADPDQWLEILEADIILAAFGYNESFSGEEGLINFKAELDAFVRHTLSQQYNQQSSPRLVLLSPIAFQDLSESKDLPDGVEINKNLKKYTAIIEQVALERSVDFINVFQATLDWFQEGEVLTLDGHQMNEKGYEKFAGLVADKIFGNKENRNEDNRPLVHQIVKEKNWFWHNDYKIPNGVHVYGRRYEPYGPDNYPAELEKIREMTAIRDRAIWAACQGRPLDLAKADAQTTQLPKVETNYQLEAGEEGGRYLYGANALAKLEVAPGYKIELFASEKEFPDLANPVQLSFDNKGRLWVAVMPTYPHWKPGDPKPKDKLLILEDTDQDGKADKQTIFADDLHLPIGFEFAPEGVYVSQGTNLVLLTDTDGDDHADQREIILSGFDDHDTHHTSSAFCADPSGAIYSGEGVFLHSNIETAYGPVRATNGGFYRYAPQRHHLERTAQLAIPNPWGIAFDEWGQPFFAETSGPDVRWMSPGTVKPVYGVATHKSFNLVEDEHKVRPTSGLEIVSSRHFPDEVQGDLLINNTIGFLGTKQHAMLEDGTGYRFEFRQDLLKGSDPNFRPVDMEFAPDGSLYLIDWHNVLIGHMQHNARDPLRDHQHGRIYRITYPERPLVELAKIEGAAIETLLENLKLPEYRSRYRTRRELRARDREEVLIALRQWIKELDQSDLRYEHHLLEGLWVTWGLNRVEESLLLRLLKAKDHKVRAAAVRTLRYVGHQIEQQADLLLEAVRDPHGRVRLEAIVAASWLEEEAGMKILKEAEQYPLDKWMVHAHEAATYHIKGKMPLRIQAQEKETDLKGADLALYKKGRTIYHQEGFCATCHQADGKGLDASGFPPIAGTNWINGNEERLIKITLHGLMGPLEINGKKYSGQVPMTGFGGMLNDEEIAAVLTYARNSFGNKARAIKAEEVSKIRYLTKDQNTFFTTEELLKQYPDN